MATEPTIMKMRLKEINQFISGINIKTKKDMPAWEVHVIAGQASIVEGIREIMANLPKGYVRGEPSLKTQAKKRFLMWRENQAMAEWKKLTPEEKAVWEGYVEEGLEFGAIREKEMERATNFVVGHRVRLIEDVQYVGATYPAGSVGTIILTEYNEIREEMMYKVKFDSLRLPTLNTFSHEIKKESK